MSWLKRIAPAATAALALALNLASFSVSAQPQSLARQGARQIQASPLGNGMTIGTPDFEYDACIIAAAQYHNVSSLIFKAIVLHESLGRPQTITLNSDNSNDFGLAGINSVHLPELKRHGIGPNELMDPCTNIFVGAWHLSKQIQRYGDTWQAVGSYHSRTPRYRDEYIQKIRKLLWSWGWNTRLDMPASYITPVPVKFLKSNPKAKMVNPQM